uniref:Pentacotripeptide-repeat region of PRORP domain-containing protein n=1 Tax=Clastoptera arizonana TaxID=38151 RepID=A0A1B6E9B4_9HEMI
MIMNSLTLFSTKLRSVGKFAKGFVRNKSSETSTQIKIPKRIDRGPTDILRALSNTVQRDPTASHYKYHDDPYLTPTSNLNKRGFALAQESGRKAARWIRQEHADLFQHKVADPPIEVFYPNVVYDENSNVDESILNKVINEFGVADAIYIYKLLQSKGIDVSRDSKQRLLELVCFYNGEDALPEKWIEERWFSQSNKGKVSLGKTWKDKGFAEELFNNISPPDSCSYSALIAGMASYGQYDGSLSYFKQARDAGHIVNIHAINNLISGANVLKESHELRWSFVEEMYSEIKQQGLTPNLGTLNSGLEVLSTMTSNKNSKSLSLKLIAEFNNLGIEPSLASYHYLLRIFCKERVGKSMILLNILDNLEGKELTIRHPKDVLFFNTAMDICRYYLLDVGLAFKLDNLLHTADNYNLIGDSYKESLYYRNFFSLACQLLTAEEFMEFYSKRVPHIYSPEPAIMEEIIKSIDFHSVHEHLPALWSDIVMFEQTGREGVMTNMLNALKNSSTTDAKLINELANVAWEIWESIQKQADDNSYNKLRWTGEMLGHIIEVLLRADRMDQCCVILNLLDKEQTKILGVPEVESLEKFIDYCIQTNNASNAMWCIQYCHDAGYAEVPSFAVKVNSSLKLSEAEIDKLVSLAGREILEKSKEVVSN